MNNEYGTRKLLVVAPQGGSGEHFARVFRKASENMNVGIRVEFRYPYIPERLMPTGGLSKSPIISQTLSAIIRDGMLDGFSEFLLADPVTNLWIDQILPLLPEAEVEPIVYDIFHLAREEFIDPQERPVWLGERVVCEQLTGFDTPINLLKEEVFDMVSETVMRTRAVTGGDTMLANPEWKKNLVDENILRDCVNRILDIVPDLGKNLILGNPELQLSLTRYVDEENRSKLSNMVFHNLAEITARQIV